LGVISTGEGEFDELGLVGAVGEEGPPIRRTGR
jgi:hypothetical protein